MAPPNLANEGISDEGAATPTLGVWATSPPEGNRGRGAPRALRVSRPHRSAKTNYLHRLIVLAHAEALESLSLLHILSGPHEHYRES